MYKDLMDTIAFVSRFAPEVGQAMAGELARQRRNIELIASENFVSPAVMAAMGSVLTNKYAEGYPGRRYYGGCAHVDVVETLAQQRACALFCADHANVQPHSGAQANFAVYFALLQPGDTVLGMNLAHGGHLTHGSPVNMSGKYYRFVPYGVSDAAGTIDYDALRELARTARYLLEFATMPAKDFALVFDDPQALETREAHLRVQRERKAREEAEEQARIQAEQEAETARRLREADEILHVKEPEEPQKPDAPDPF